MQTSSFAPVRLLPLALALLTVVPPAHAAPVTHAVTLGPARRVPYTPPQTSDTGKPADTATLKVRALTVDGRQKDWTTGDAHDVTDRSFVIRRALRLNDALPTEPAARWTWQPGPWVLVDRATGRITALHLPDFDATLSDAVWFRDYAAYCGIATTIKGGLFAIVAQLGVRKAVVQKQLGKWPQPDHPTPVCQPAQWQRLPMRVTLQPTGGDPITFDVVGTASLIEEGDTPEDTEHPLSP
jgi:hypothetical protein